MLRRTLSLIGALLCALPTFGQPTGLSGNDSVLTDHTTKQVLAPYGNIVLPDNYVMDFGNTNAFSLRYDTASSSWVLATGNWGSGDPLDLITIPIPGYNIHVHGFLNLMSTNGLQNVSSFSGAAIGSDLEAWDAELDALAASAFSQTLPPGVNDDASAGYSKGALWIDTTTHKFYACVDNTVGAAVWADLTAGGNTFETTQFSVSGSGLVSIRDLATVTNLTLQAKTRIEGSDGTTYLRMGTGETTSDFFASLYGYSPGGKGLYWNFVPNSSAGSFYWQWNGAKNFKLSDTEFAWFADNDSSPNFRLDHETSTLASNWANVYLGRDLRGSSWTNTDSGFVFLNTLDTPPTSAPSNLSPGFHPLIFSESDSNLWYHLGEWTQVSTSGQVNSLMNSTSNGLQSEIDTISSDTSAFQNQIDAKTLAFQSSKILDGGLAQVQGTNCAITLNKRLVLDCNHDPNDQQLSFYVRTVLTDPFFYSTAADIAPDQKLFLLQTDSQVPQHEGAMWLYLHSPSGSPEVVMEVYHTNGVGDVYSNVYTAPFSLSPSANSTYPQDPVDLSVMVTDERQGGDGAPWDWKFNITANGEVVGSSSPTMLDEDKETNGFSGLTDVSDSTTGLPVIGQDPRSTAFRTNSVFASPIILRTYTFGRETVDGHGFEDIVRSDLHPWNDQPWPYNIWTSNTRTDGVMMSFDLRLTKSAYHNLIYSAGPNGYALMLTNEYSLTNATYHLLGPEYVDAGFGMFRTNLALPSMSHSLLMVDDSGNVTNVLLDPSVTLSGQTLSASGGGGGGSGTVTSVGLSLPSQFTVSGSPVTTSGTLTGAWANQTANTILAGPTAGAAAAPSFRVLDVADLPIGLSSPPVIGSVLSSQFGDTWDLISPNTSTVKKFLAQTGTGAGGAFPVWTALQPSDLPAGLDATPVIGSILSSSAGDSWDLIPPNTNTTTKFLAQTGTAGGGSALPAWSTIQRSDLPAMVGADGTFPGASGLVPAPAAADNTKFLRGDGAWADAASSGGVQTNQLESTQFEITSTPHISLRSGVITTNLSTRGITTFYGNAANYFQLSPNASGVVSGYIYDNFFAWTSGGQVVAENMNQNGYSSVGARRWFWNGTKMMDLTGTAGGPNQFLLWDYGARNPLTVDLASTLGGDVRLGPSITGSANLSLTHGFVFINSMDGVPTGTPGNDTAHYVPVVFDRPDSSLYYYLSGWKNLTPTMTGANGTTAGAKGLVPAPAATDNTKYLRGDGSYADPGNYVPTKAVAANYTATSSDTIIVCYDATAAGNAITITLPAAPANGKRYVVYRGDGVGTVTVQDSNANVLTSMTGATACFVWVYSSDVGAYLRISAELGS